MFNARQIVTAFLTTLVLTSATFAQAPKPAKLEVFPADVDLNTRRDRQSLVVQASYPDGITRDVTKQAKYTPANAALVKSTGSTLTPVADGETKLKVEYAGLSIDVPVKVQQATADREISFRLDVMPVFMKAGCNTGSLSRCGSAGRTAFAFRCLALIPRWRL